MGNASSGGGSREVQVEEERCQQPQKSIEELLPSQTLNIYTEAAEATLWSIGVFALADLRGLALPVKFGSINKNNKNKNNDNNSTPGNSNNITFEDANEILMLPINEMKFSELNLKHKDLLKRKKSGDYEEVLIPSYYIDKHHDRPRSMEVYYVGDDKSDSECVYCIGYDSYRQVITLVFRGSITPRDWIEDTKAIIDEIPNPLKLKLNKSKTNNNNNNNNSSDGNNNNNNSSSDSSNNDQEEEEGLDQLPDTVGIHWGFRNYLHGNSLKPLPKYIRKLTSSVGLEDEDMDDGSSSNNDDDDDDEKTEEGNGNDDKEENKDTDDDNKKSTDDNNNNNKKEDEKEQSENDDDDDNNDDIKSKASSTKSSRTKKTKIQIILEQLHKMKSKYPNDPIFITGHSLGGALSLIASLAVASDPILCTIPSISSSQQQQTLPPGFTPVTVVAVANPKVGNKAFNDVIDYLELNHKLRCLTIHNEHDIVPMMTSPNLTSKSDPNHPEREFCKYHPGFRLLLKEDRFEIDRHGNGTNNNGGGDGSNKVGSSVCSRGRSTDDDDEEEEEDKNDMNGKDNENENDGVDKLNSSNSSIQSTSSSPPPPSRRRSSVNWLDMAKDVLNTIQNQHSQLSSIVTKNVSRNQHNYRLYLERILSFEEKGLNEIYLNSYYSELLIQDGDK